MTARAAPLCSVCGAPFERAEIPWRRDDGVPSGWRLGPVYMVCGNDHRKLVEPT